MLLSLFLILCFLAGFLVSRVWHRLALAQGWFDHPNERSSHTRPTPKGGGAGLAVLLLMMLSALWFAGLVEGDLFWLCLPGLGLAFAGLLDDLHELGVLTRLLVQFTAVFVALLLLGTLPALPLPGLVFSHQLSLWLLLLPGWLWLINLYNFMDGIDGLAASEGIFVALALAWFALDAGRHDSSLLLLGLAVLLAGFLCFNWAPAALFMGDAGSNFLGYLLPACGLYLAVDGVVSVWTLLVLLGSFVVDSTLTLFKRVWSGAVWYHGHRSHAYQIIARVRGSHATVVVAVALINVCWLLPLAAATVAFPDWGGALLVVAYLPLLLLVHRSQLRYIGARLQ